MAPSAYNGVSYLPAVASSGALTDKLFVYVAATTIYGVTSSVFTPLGIFVPYELRRHRPGESTTSVADTFRLYAWYTPSGPRAVTPLFTDSFRAYRDTQFRTGDIVTKRSVVDPTIDVLGTSFRFFLVEPVVAGVTGLGRVGANRDAFTILSTNSRTGRVSGGLIKGSILALCFGWNSPSDVFLRVVHTSASFAVSSAISLSPLPIGGSGLLVALSAIYLLPDSTVGATGATTSKGDIPPSWVGSKFTGDAPIFATTVATTAIAKGWGFVPFLELDPHGDIPVFIVVATTWVVVTIGWRLGSSFGGRNGCTIFLDAMVEDGDTPGAAIGRAHGLLFILDLGELSDI